MIRRRYRFSLASLLIVSTAIVLFFGYSQWRRQNILRQAAQFERRGARIALPASYGDYLWQRHPRSATIYYTKIRSIALDSQGLIRQLYERKLLEEELKKFGVAELSRGFVSEDRQISEFLYRTKSAKR
jgi:hypothetical protein